MAQEEGDTARAPSPDSSPPATSPSKTKMRNAFTELMTAKTKPVEGAEDGGGGGGGDGSSSITAGRPAQASKISRVKGAFPGRDALGVYVVNPAAHPSSTVVFFTPDFVAIHDKYPKSLIHTLLLPRSARHNLLHPFDAFEDAEFLASVRAAAERLKKLVAGELRRRLGGFSIADARRNAVLDGVGGDGDAAAATATAALPEGRDWEAEVRVGVHARPSMNHLHVHVMSRDMCGGGMKKKNHYLSFNTAFLVDLADFPLAPDDWRRGGSIMRDSDLLCWRCGKNFGNKFENLKRHLAEELDEWKRE